MLDICYEELEELKHDVEEENFIGVEYLDTWNFEDEYSHNHIAENRTKFISLANEYFRNNDMPYIMREVCDNAMVCDKNGNILH